MRRNGKLRHFHGQLTTRCPVLPPTMIRILAENGNNETFPKWFSLLPVLCSPRNLWNTFLVLALSRSAPDPHDPRVYQPIITATSLYCVEPHPLHLPHSSARCRPRRVSNACAPRWVIRRAVYVQIGPSMLVSLQRYNPCRNH